jgi:hypothetical protein
MVNKKSTIIISQIQCREPHVSLFCHRRGLGNKWTSLKIVDGVPYIGKFKCLLGKWKATKEMEVCPSCFTKNRRLVFV